MQIYFFRMNAAASSELRSDFWVETEIKTETF